MQRGGVVVSGEPLGRGARGGGGGGVARGRLLPPGVSPCIAVLLLRRSGLFAFVFLNRVLLPGRPAGTIENWKGRRKNRVRMQPAAGYPKQEEREKEDTLDKHHISQALKTQPLNKMITKERNNPKHRETQRKVINAA